METYKHRLFFRDIKNNCGVMVLFEQEETPEQENISIDKRKSGFKGRTTRSQNTTSFLRSLAGCNSSNSKIIMK